MTGRIDLKGYPQLMTIGEVANLLRCHQNTVRSYVRRGTLKCFRRNGGRTILFKRSDVSRMISPVGDS